MRRSAGKKDNGILVLIGALLFISAIILLSRYSMKDEEENNYYQIAKPVLSSARNRLNPTPTPTLTPTPTPSPVLSWETNEATEVNLSHKKQRSATSFIYFSGIVLEKKKRELKLGPVNPLPDSILEPLTVLAGENTIITIHDSSRTGLSADTWAEIPIGALVGALGSYSRNQNRDFVDTNAIRWDGRKGEIEVIAPRSYKSQ